MKESDGIDYDTLMSPWILVDDGHRGLSPLCDLRATFELRTGAMTTLERLTLQMGAPPIALRVPNDLAELVASRHTLPVNPPDREPNAVVINGRQTSAHDATLLARPWDVLVHCERNLPGDLELLARTMRPLEPDRERCITVVGGRPVLIGRGVTIHPNVVFDTSAGSIVLEDGATVRSMSVMVGPGYIGRDSVVVNHAHIRAGTVIGPHCKVGGEVNACLFQGYSNKAHSGYLGNSHVGEWVNLGADTVTSNLKNTYGEVRMQTDPDLPGAGEATGMQFLGSIIGDHVKTAIGTRLLTGTCLHTGAMIATSRFPPKCVRRFAFLTDNGEERYEFEKFMQVAQAVMRRRELNVPDALQRRLAEVYA